jgi:hypothetical protein
MVMFMTGCKVAGAQNQPYANESAHDGCMIAFAVV